MESMKKVFVTLSRHVHETKDIILEVPNDWTYNDISSCLNDVYKAVDTSDVYGPQVNDDGTFKAVEIKPGAHTFDLGGVEFSGDIPTYSISLVVAKK